jgi:hypothetical protein
MSTLEKALRRYKLDLNSNLLERLNEQNRRKKKNV